MDVVALLANAKKAGVKIEVVEGEMQIEAKQSQKHWLDKLRPYKQEILSLLTGEPTEKELGEPSKQVEHYRPFPVHALPGPARAYVQAAAKAMGAIRRSSHCRCWRLWQGL